MKAFLKINIVVILLSFYATLLNADIFSTYTLQDEDAVEETVSSGNMNLTSSDLEMVYDGSTKKQIVGVRFQNITIPSGSVITNAYIRFNSDSSNQSGTTKLYINVEDTDNSSVFTSANFNLSSRTLSSSRVTWVPDTWVSDGDNGDPQTTPDLSALVQEVIDRAGWSSGNSISFIISAGPSCGSSSCMRRAETHHDDTQSPQLVIEYTKPDMLYAYDDSLHTNPNVTSTIDILSNDTASSGNTIVPSSVTIVTAPTHGTYTLNSSSGTVSYTPTTDYIGTDTFTYTVRDNLGNISNIATATINIGYFAGDRDFTIRNPEDTRNIRGNYIIGGNTNLCTYDEDKSDDPTSTGNAKPWDGKCYFTTSNSYPTKYLDIDGDSSTVNSSSFELNVPSNSTVIWAGLYWQGVVHNSDIDEDFMDYQTISGATQISTNKGIDLSADNNGNGTYGAEKVKFKIPGGTYVDLTADQLDFSDLGYAGYKDVTDMLNATSPNGVYTVADIKSHQGTETNHGNYAGWSLVVIYENPNEDYRNITLFDGFVTVTSSYSSDLQLSGFLTPATAPVDTTISYFTMDGDNGRNNLYLESQKGVITDLKKPSDGSSGLFDSTIGDINNRNPEEPSARMDLNTLSLSNVLGTLETSATLRPRSGGDRYTASFFVIASTLYLPEFCYDYAYKQQGQYFTEENDGTHMPRLSGDVYTSQNIDMTIYIRSKISEIPVENMYVDIEDINTSEVTYVSNSVRLARIGDLTPESFNDSPTLNVGANYVKDIPIGTVDKSDYIYIYYTLNPIISDLNNSINVTMRYDLNVDGELIPYSTTLGEDEMPMCSNSNFVYAPAKGIFNVVHNNYYTLDANPSSGTSYYNLPTQVVNREGNFKVISLDPDALDTLKPTATMVGIEMIDASAFHDTNASCYEQNSSISPLVYIFLGNPTNLPDLNATAVPFTQAAIQSAITNGQTRPIIATPDQFYNFARENAAFRISYQLTNDGNDDLLQISQGDSAGEYSINYTELVQDIGQCSQTVLNPVNLSTPTQQVSVACRNDSDHLSLRDIAICLECIRGNNTKYVCSRDNFAIRPEAFLMQLDDQNQTDPTMQTDITTLNDSGSVGAVAPAELNFAADYSYKLEVNATNFLDNTASNGYTHSLNSIDNSEAMYMWSPRRTIVAHACNDDTNKSIDISFVNGYADINTSLAEVGDYILKMVDHTWTSVDHNSSFMTHHTAPYFYLDHVDCIENNDTVQAINANTNNGCNISSNHTAENGIQYNDYDVSFHPYRFLLAQALSVGDANSTVNNKPFVYMANIDQNESISVHLNSSVAALGFNNTPTTNYVTGCFSENTNFSIGKSPTTNPTISYQYRTHALDINGSRIAGLDLNNTIAAGDVNDSATMVIPASFWQKDQNGSLSLETNLNFNREVNVSVNPEDINYTLVDMNDTDNANLFYADLLDDKFAEGNVTIAQSVKHYYGSTFSHKKIVTCNGSPCETGSGHLNNAYGTTTYIYFTIYCNNGTGCDPATDLPAGSAPAQNSQWWINTQHDKNVTQGIDGIIGTISGTSPTGTVTIMGTDKIFTQQYETFINYDGSFVAEANITMQSSPWLIYNETNASAVSNSFIVEFISESDWNGKFEEDTTTNGTGSPGTNRRIMW